MTKRRFLNNDRRRVIVGFLRLHPGIVDFIEKRPRLHAFVNRGFINGTVDSTAARPQAYSLWTGRPIGTPTTEKNTDGTNKPDDPVDYITWTGLIDRRYTGRHLPPAPASYNDRLPSLDRVLALYKRRVFIPSHNCSALLCFFAQWFTDSFLRKDQADERLNTSNHEIDLCEIYGLDAATARLLRTREKGKLRTSADGRFPDRLFGADLQVNPHYAGLPYMEMRNGKKMEDVVLASLGGGGEDPNKQYLVAAEIEKRRGYLYATGLERGNSTILYTAISSIFIREHNRLCDLLADAHPDWDDDRLFETARNINIVMLLYLTIDEYINQVGQPPMKLKLARLFAERKHWYRANRIAIEFNLLYRWHSFVPEKLQVDGETLDHTRYRFNNEVLERYGAAAVLAAAAREPGGQVGLHNNPDFLWQAEYAAHQFARSQRLRSFVEYQAAFDWSPAKDFLELTGDKELAAELSELYNGEIRDVEFLVGLFAQERTPPSVLPPLLNTMVAVDAFSQILTNPLLAENVYGPAAFGEEGLKVIEETTSFHQLVMRNLMGEAPPPNRVSFAYPPTPVQ